MAIEDELPDATVNWSEAGTLQVKELDRVVLSASSSWATVAFLMSERDKDSGAYLPPKVQLRRYRRRGGKLVVERHFTLSTERQAIDLADAVRAWFGAGAPGKTLEATAASAARVGRGGARVDVEER